MQESWEDRFRHVVPNNEVCVGCAKVASISRGALSERGISVGELRVSREGRGENHRAPIERVLTGNLKLLLGRERFVVCKTGPGAIVRNDAKNTLAYRGSRLERRLSGNASGSIKSSKEVCWPNNNDGQHDERVMNKMVPFVI